MLLSRLDFRLVNQPLDISWRFSFWNRSIRRLTSFRWVLWLEVFLSNFIVYSLIRQSCPPFVLPLNFFLCILILLFQKTWHMPSPDLLQLLLLLFYFLPLFASLKSYIVLLFLVHFKIHCELVSRVTRINSESLEHAPSSGAPDTFLF